MASLEDGIRRADTTTGVDPTRDLTIAAFV
jgi:hypothetical protein